MTPVVAAAGMQAAGQTASGLLGGLFGNRQQKKQNKFNQEQQERNNQFAREQAAKQFDYDQMAASTQNQYNVEAWNMQNAYNTPAAQMQRYTEAGLNPNLMYSQGSSGNSSSAPDFITATQQAPTQSAPKKGAYNWENQVSKILNVQQVLQTMNMQRQGEILRLQKEGIDIDNKAKVFNLNNMLPLKEGLTRNQMNLAGGKSEMQGLQNNTYLQTGLALSQARLAAAQELANKYKLTNQQQSMDISLRNLGINPRTTDPFLYYLARPNNEGKDWKIPTYIGSRLGLEALGEIMGAINPLSRLIPKKLSRKTGSTTTKYGKSTVTTYDYE